MKQRYLSALLPVLLFGHPASAADLDVPRVQPPPVALFSWTNFYFGVNAGYAWSRAQSELRGAVVSSASDSLSGVAGGVQAGFNYQFGQFVVGLEGDYQYTNQKISKTGFIGIDPTNETDQLKPFVTARARIGVAIDRWLIYATGGAAHVALEVRHVLPDGSVTIAGWGKWGWVVGAGVEVAPYDQISLRLEYLYLDSGKLTFNDTYIGIPGATFEWQLQSNIFRIAANFLL
jgi:outer membrane immunogenic protein